MEATARAEPNRITEAIDLYAAGSRAGNRYDVCSAASACAPDRLGISGIGNRQLASDPSGDQPRLGLCEPPS